MKFTATILLFITILLLAIATRAGSFIYNKDILPGTTNIVIVDTADATVLMTLSAAKSTNYYSTTVGITNNPLWNSNTISIVVGSASAVVLTWTNSPDTNTLLIQTNTSAATAITNLAAIIATNFPTINATMGNGTISLTSYGTPIGVTTAGQWATNAVTTNATPATLAITAFGLLASAQTYPIPGLSFNHTVGATTTTNVNGTNTLGAWQQIRYQIISYATNGVVPGWNFETGTK